MANINKTEKKKDSKKKRVISVLPKYINLHCKKKERI